MAQLILTATGLVQIVRNIGIASLAEAWSVHGMTILCFAGLSHTLRLADPSMYSVATLKPTASQAPPELLYVDMLYFSTATITSTGFGDIVPASALSMFLANAEMLLGMFFALFILSQTLSKAASDAMRSRAASTVSAHGEGGCARSFRRLAAAPHVRAARLFVRRNILLVSALLQAVHFGVLFMHHANLFDGAHRHGKLLWAAVVLQLAQGVVIVATSLKYARHLDTVSMSFLCQSYASICLSFAGLYCLLFMGNMRCALRALAACRRLAMLTAACCSCFHLASFDREHISGFWSIAAQFASFSLTVMTCTG